MKDWERQQPDVVQAMREFAATCKIASGSSLKPALDGAVGKRLHLVLLLEQEAIDNGVLPAPRRRARQPKIAGTGGGHAKRKGAGKKRAEPESDNENDAKPESDDEPPNKSGHKGMTAEEKAEHAKKIRQRALASKAETEDPTILAAAQVGESLSTGGKRRRDEDEESDERSASKRKHVSQDDNGALVDKQSPADDGALADDKLPATEKTLQEETLQEEETLQQWEILQKDMIIFDA